MQKNITNWPKRFSPASRVMTSAEDKKQSVILDLEQLIKEYSFAWMLSEKRNAKWCAGRRKFAGVSKIEDAEFEIIYDDLEVSSTTPFSKKLLEKLAPNENDTLSLVKTVFANNTKESQEYNFKTQRETTSAFTVYREKGFSLGNETKVGFRLPYKIGSVSTGFDARFDFTKGEEKTVTETMIWSTDSKIVVPKQSHTTAEFVVEEDKYDGDFSMTSTLSGKVLVKILRANRKPTDKGLIMVFSINVVDIFEHFMTSSKYRNVQDKINHVAKILDHKVVQIDTSGKYNLRFGVKQHIRLSQDESAYFD